MSEMKRNPEAVAEAIRGAQRIAICSHVNPDGDTIGCALAMRLGLQAMGKEVQVFCHDKVPDNLMFLPGAGEIRNPEHNTDCFDLMLAVDVSDRERLASCKSLLERSAQTAQIDHHPTNPLYMEVNSVDGKAPAACILVYEQLKTLGVPMTREIAMCLYTGISTDTGNFSFSATNAEAFAIMSELMEADLPLSEMSRILFRERSRAQLKLMGKAISSLRFEGKEGRIAVMTLTRQDFRDCGAQNEHADTIVNLGLETTGTQMALLGREDEPGIVKFSLRAKSPQRIDDVAQRLGGGGHPQASGVTMKGTLEEATRKVAAAMAEKLENSDERLL